MIPRRMRAAVSTILAAVAASAPVHALDHVVLQLKWRHQFQFAGYYAAVTQGYYRDAGFDVELREVPLAPGRYTLRLTVSPPGSDPHVHFGRHTDKETGVGPWFKPFTLDYEFVYAGVGKKGGY